MIFFKSVLKGVKIKVASNGIGWQSVLQDIGRNFLSRLKQEMTGNICNVPNFSLCCSTSPPPSSFPLFWSLFILSRTEQVNRWRRSLELIRQENEGFVGCVSVCWLQSRNRCDGPSWSVRARAHYLSLPASAPPPRTLTYDRWIVSSFRTTTKLEKKGEK